jgi:hypothetical protein
MIPLPFKFQAADDKEPAWPDLEGKDPVEGTGVQIVCLDKGMASGRPSIGLRIDLPDGSAVFAETSARLLCIVAKAIMARYPDLFEDD